MSLFTWKHTQGRQFPLEDQTILAYSKSPYTDNGEGVGANTSSLTVVAKSFSTLPDLTSLPFIRRAQPVEKDSFCREECLSL